tara:strand:+ start:2086 stop:2454 length:369 start_codon:yes stop_codon:yes gene_type:complete
MKKKTTKIKKTSKKPEEVKYTFDIVSIEANKNNIISQITYEFAGTIGKYSSKRTGIASGALVVHFDKEQIVSTLDYKNVTKRQLIKYIKDNISNNYYQALKDIIYEQLYPTKKNITEFSWNK